MYKEINEITFYEKVIIKKSKDIKICLELNKTIDLSEIYYFDNENNIIENVKYFDKIVKIKVIFQNLQDLLAHTKRLAKLKINYCVK